MTHRMYKSVFDLNHDITSASYQTSFVTDSVFEMEASPIVIFYFIFFVFLLVLEF